MLYVVILMQPPQGHRTTVAGTRDYWPLRLRLFDESARLDRLRLRSATSGGRPMPPGFHAFKLYRSRVLRRWAKAQSSQAVA